MKLQRRNTKKQTRERRRKYFLLLLVSFVLLIGLGFGVRYGLSRVQWFALKKIEVKGSPRTLSQEKIIKLAQVQLGTNLFKIDLETVRDRLKTHEFFSAVYVHRQFPHQLVIEVKEYFPEFVLHTGRMYYIDQEGTLFRDITETKDSKDFPVLTGVTEDMIIQEPNKVRAILKSAVELKQSYLQTRFFQENGLSEIHFEKNFGFTLYPIREKCSIRVGRTQFAEKMLKLSTLWDRMKAKQFNLSSIDLNYSKGVLLTKRTAKAL